MVSIRFRHSATYRSFKYAIDTEHFLCDTLGSVHQLTDSTDAVTLVRGYDPYGVVGQESIDLSCFAVIASRQISYQEAVFMGNHSLILLRR